MSECKKSRKNPNEIQTLSKESYAIVKKALKDRADKFIQIGPKKYLEDDYYAKYKEEIYNFKVLDSDVWVVSLPRSGTTLTQELVWQICTNLDFDTGFKIPLVERFPFFEFPAYFDKSVKEILLKENCDNPIKCRAIKDVFTPLWEKPEPTEPRFIKTHLPLSLLPPELLTSGCKVVYVARNPKDQTVSRYNFYKMNKKPVPNDFQDFWELTEKDLLPCSPYFEHIDEAWKNRSNENLLFLFYEDIVKDLKGSIIKVGQFFGKNVTQSQIDQLVDHLKIDNFKNNKSVSRDYFDYFPPAEENFVRKGKVGSWKEEFFTKELSDRADKWIQTQCEKTGIKFPNFT